MMLLGFLLTSDVVVINEPEKSVPPLNRIGWELIGEPNPKAAIQHYLSPESLRPIRGSDTIFAVTVAYQWADKKGVQRANNLGFLVNCCSSKVRVDWGYRHYGEHRIMEYRNQGKFRAPVGWQVALMKRVCKDI